jgi:tetratricopeptide (TPR) repeat protein
MSLRQRLFGLLPHRIRRAVEEQIRKEEVWPTIQRGRDLFIDDPGGEETREFLARAVERFPDNAEIRLLYGTSLLDIDPEDGMREAMRAIDLFPHEPLYVIRVAALMFRMGRPKLSRDLAARAREMRGEESLFGPQLIQLEAHFALQDGDEDAAESGFLRALEREPDNGDFAVDLAALLSERGRREEALGVVERSLPIVRWKDGLERMRTELMEDA